MGLFTFQLEPVFNALLPCVRRGARLGVQGACLEGSVPEGQAASLSWFIAILMIYSSS